MRWETPDPRLQRGWGDEVRAGGSPVGSRGLGHQGADTPAVEWRLGLRAAGFWVCEEERQCPGPANPASVFLPRGACLP